MNREPFSLQDAWQNVGDLYAAIVSLFGAPFEIATQFILMRQNRRDILAWFGPVEALARLCRVIATKRDAVEAAFRPYRPPANAVQTALSDAQRELDLALNTS